MFRTGNDDLDAPSILVKEDGLRSIYSMEPLDKKKSKKLVNKNSSFMF